MPSAQPNRFAPRVGLGWLPALLLLVLVLAGAAAAWLALRPRPVPTVTVERGPVIKAFYATGTVRPDREYVLKAKVAGKLTDLAVRENSPVQKGQLLARIDERQRAADVAKISAELREAQAQAAADAPQRLEVLARIKEAREQFAIADRILKRTESLIEKNAVNPTDLDAARRSHVQWSNTVAALESQLGNWKITSQRAVEVATANLKKAEADLADCDIRAPITGLVLERYIENDQIVGVNEKLFLVAAVDDKVMKAAVDEEDVRKVRDGQRVDMQLYAYNDLGTPEKPYILGGTVYEVLPSANPTNKTYEVKVRFESPPPTLKVGMTAELNFEEQRKLDRLIVPVSAVLDSKVYKPRGGGKYEAVPVRTGVRSLERVEVVDGLIEGDIIVRDAKQVAPVKLPPAKAPVVPTRTGDRDVAGQ